MGGPTLVTFSFASLCLLFMVCHVQCVLLDYGENCNGKLCDTQKNLICSTIMPTSLTCICIDHHVYNASLGQCIESSFDSPCKRDEQCPVDMSCHNDTVLLTKICVGLPPAVRNLKVNQSRDEATQEISFHITWTPGAYNGQLTAYVVDLIPEDTSPSNLYHRGFAISPNITSFVIHNIVPGSDYRVYVQAQTAAGEGAKAGPVEIVSFDGKPGLVKNLMVSQVTTSANEMRLYFECPALDERNGVIREYVIQKNVTSDPTSSDEFVISNDHIKQCYRIVRASQVGGLKVNKTYSFEVKARTTYDGDYSAPVTLFVEAVDVNDGLDGTTIGLAVGLTLALLVGLVLVIYIVYKRSSRSKSSNSMLM